MTQENPHPLKFATKFPDWHPRKGQLTFFPANILYGLIESEQISKLDFLMHLNRPHIHCPQECDAGYNLSKGHTARKGHIFKVGDWIQPVTEDGTKICPPLEIKWVRRFEYIDIPVLYGTTKDYNELIDLVEEMAENDGLCTEDFIAWFSREPFDGQLIGWTADPYTNL